MPTKWPAVVMPGASPVSVLTSPKSVRYACSSSPVSSTLPGLTSRWTSPRRWAASSAERDLGDDLHGALGLERPFAHDGGEQVGAVDEAHGDVELAVDLPRLVDRDHVRVVDRGGEHRLALEALAEPAVAREVVGDQLQRHGPGERDLGRAVDPAHAALAGDAVDLVAREDGSRYEFRHSASYTLSVVAAGGFPPVGSTSIDHHRRKTPGRRSYSHASRTRYLSSPGALAGAMEAREEQE